MEEHNAYELLVGGRSLLSQGEPERAALLLERANTEEPGKGSILESLGVAYYRLGRYGDAAGCFELALEVDPTNDYAYFCLGLCRLKEGRPDIAAGHFKIAWSLRPLEEYREKAARFTVTEAAGG